MFFEIFSLYERVLPISHRKRISVACFRKHVSSGINFTGRLSLLQENLYTIFYQRAEDGVLPP